MEARHSSLLPDSWLVRLPIYRCQMGSDVGSVQCSWFCMLSTTRSRVSPRRPPAMGEWSPCRWVRRRGTTKGSRPQARTALTATARSRHIVPGLHHLGRVFPCGMIIEELNVLYWLSSDLELGVLTLYNESNLLVSILLILVETYCSYRELMVDMIEVTVAQLP